jgi:hypothetical protein
MSQFGENIIEKVLHKKALYYYDVGNIHRPNINELNNKTFSCPRCKAPLKLIIRKPLSKSIYMCTDCDNFLPYSNILHSEEAIAAHKEKAKVN